jgi:hypothetical protein
MCKRHQLVKLNCMVTRGVKNSLIGVQSPNLCQFKLAKTLLHDILL